VINGPIPHGRVKKSEYYIFLGKNWKANRVGATFRCSYWNCRQNKTAPNKWCVSGAAQIRQGNQNEVTSNSEESSITRSPREKQTGHPVIGVDESGVKNREQRKRFKIN